MILPNLILYWVMKNRLNLETILIVVCCPRPPRGNLSFFTFGVAPHGFCHPVGDRIQPGCTYGYYLNGSDRAATCQSTGEWDVEPNLACVSGKFEHLKTFFF